MNDTTIDGTATTTIDGTDDEILTPEEQARMVGDIRERTQRMSSIDGFTIHHRPGRRPRVHLLRPYPRCLQNVSADMVEEVVGSREMAIERVGNGGLPCPKCFPKPDDA